MHNIPVQEYAKQFILKYIYIYIYIYVNNGYFYLHMAFIYDEYTLINANT